MTDQIAAGSLALTLESILHQLGDVKAWRDLGAHSTADAELANATARLRVAAGVARTHRPHPALLEGGR